MSNTLPMPRKLWQHANPKKTDIYKFMKVAEVAAGKTFNASVKPFGQTLEISSDPNSQDYESLYRWSCDHRADFWRFAFEYFPLVYSGKVPERVHDESARMDTVPYWFPGVKMNFAENILFVGDRDGRQAKSPGKEDDKIACTGVREGSFVEQVQHTTWQQLRQRVGLLSQAMRAHGVRKGDSIALVASVCLDSLTVFLAAATIGALFSSSSPDMGTQGILDRLRQSKPKFLFMDDCAVYCGKKIDLKSKTVQIVKGMMSVSEFQGIIVLPRYQDVVSDISSIPHCQHIHDYVTKATSDELEFEQLDFPEPMIILYSSGTTGMPKCILHSVGGVVLSGHKESRLQRSVDSNSVQLQYTTTGWMMYMSAVQLLLVGARTVMFDGNPFYPNPRNLLRLVAKEKVTHLGISPRYLQTLQLEGVVPKEVADLSNLQVCELHLL